jgi:hypothetical protein
MSSFAVLGPIGWGLGESCTCCLISRGEGNASRRVLGGAPPGIARSRAVCLQTPQGLETVTETLRNWI